MTIETKKVASAKEIVAYIDRLNYMGEELVYALTTREDGADVQYRHFDAKGFGMIEIVVDGKLEVVRFFNLYRFITVDFQLGDYTPDYSEYEVIAVEAETELADAEDINDKLIECIDDHKVSYLAQEQAIIEAERAAGTFTTDINDEYVTFKNWHIVRIRNINLDLYYERSSTGRKLFCSGGRQIAAAKIPAMYIGKEIAREQDKTFPAFFKPYQNRKTGRYATVHVSLTYADDSEHHFNLECDSEEERLQFISETKAFAGETPCEFITRCYVETDGSEEDDDDSVWELLPDITDDDDADDELVDEASEDYFWECARIINDKLTEISLVERMERRITLHGTLRTCKCDPAEMYAAWYPLSKKFFFHAPDGRALAGYDTAEQCLAVVENLEAEYEKPYSDYFFPTVEVVIHNFEPEYKVAINGEMLTYKRFIGHNGYMLDFIDSPKYDAFYYRDTWYKPHIIALEKNNGFSAYADALDCDERESFFEIMSERGACTIDEPTDENDNPANSEKTFEHITLRIEVTESGEIRYYKNGERVKLWRAKGVILSTAQMRKIVDIVTDHGAVYTGGYNPTKGSYVFIDINGNTNYESQSATELLEAFARNDFSNIKVITADNAKQTVA